MAKQPRQSAVDKVHLFSEVLREAEPRPKATDAREDKKNYAQRLSRHMARMMAAHLRSYLPEVLPNEGSTSTGRARSGRNVKRLDVNYSTTDLGLGFGVSIKTLNFPDPKTVRYTKNPTRLDNELRAEAMDHHERQPYSVLAALVLLPEDACDDGDPKRPKTSSSSFSHVVRVLRHRIGRDSHRDEAQLFECGFVGLYDYAKKTVGFFDLRETPPQFGRPKLMDLGLVVSRMMQIYDTRNFVSRPWDKPDASAPLFSELDDLDEDDEEDKDE